MNIEVYPTTFEAYDDEILMFRVELFDEYLASVDIKYLMDVNTWDKVSPIIRQCLVDMKLSDVNDNTET